jgi:hypothetical protein
MLALRHYGSIAGVLAGIALSTNLAHALTVRDYVNLRDGSDVDKFKTTKVYISGLGAGYAWANSARLAEKLPPLFCLPDSFKGMIDFSPLIDDEIGQPYVQRDDPIELLLLSSLQRTYPCPAGPVHAP